MSYIVNYNALKTVLDGYKTAVATCNEGIASVMEQEAAIEASTNISGNNADRMREYLKTVYSYASTSLNSLLQLFLQNYMVYIEAYYEQIDSATDTCITETELSDRYASLQGKRNLYQQIGRAAEDSVRKISDLVRIPNLDISSADAQFSKILTSLDNLDGDINALERTHVSSDFTEIDELISKLEAFFLEVVKQDKNFKTGFTVESFLSLTSVPGLITVLNDTSVKMGARSSEVSLALNKLEKRFELQRLMEQEELEKRQQQAKWAKIGVNVVVGVLSTAAIVVFPYAAPVIGMASGLVTSSFSAAADEYTKHGMAINEWDKGRIGAHAIIGTTTGLIGGFVPAGAGLIVKASVKGLSNALEGAATTSYDQLSTYGRIVDTREILIDSATKGGAAFTGSLIGGAVSSNVKGVGISAIDLSRDDPLSKMHGLSVFLFEGGKSASTGIISRGVSGLTSQVIANSSDGTFVTPSELDLTAISSDMFSPESIGKDFVGSGLSGAAGDYVKLRTPDKDTGLTPIIQYKLGHTPDPETGTAPVVDEALKSLEKKEQWEKTHLTDWHSTDWENTASSPEEILQLEEMERNGELDVYPSDLGPATYTSDKAPLTKNPIEVTFQYNIEKYGEEEFLSQGDMQEEGLNGMSVAEYLENYERYQAKGRDLDDPQKLYRLGIVEANAYEKGEHMISDLLRNNPGLSYEEASHMIDQKKLVAEAQEEVSSQAALHNPDQIAGGDPNNVYAMGSGKVNSSFGAQWRWERAEKVHEQVLEASKGMTREEMEHTRLNIRFNYESKKDKGE